MFESVKSDSHIFNDSVTFMYAYRPHIAGYNMCKYALNSLIIRFILYTAYRPLSHDI